MPANNNPYGSPSYSFYKRGQTDAGVPTYDFFKSEEDEAPSLTLPQGGYADQFVTKIPERNEPDMRLAQNMPPQGAQPAPTGGAAAPAPPPPGSAGGGAPSGGSGGKKAPEDLDFWTSPARLRAPTGSRSADFDPNSPDWDSRVTNTTGSSQESGTKRVLSKDAQTSLQKDKDMAGGALDANQGQQKWRRYHEDLARQFELQKAPVERQYDDKEYALELDRRKRVDEIEKELEQERLKSKNPNDFWDSRDTKSSVALSIGMALGAFATRPGEENQGARVLNDAMNRHMRNREEQVRKLYEKRGRTRENYADMQARLEAERRQAIKQVHYQVADQIARSVNPVVRKAFKKRVEEDINAPASRSGGLDISRVEAPAGGTPFGGSSSPGGPSGGAPGSSTDAARDFLGKAGAGIAKGAAAAKDTVSKYGNKVIDKLPDSDLSVLDPPPPGTPDKYGLLSPEGRLKQAEQDDRAALEYQRDYVMQRQRRGDAPPGPGELPEPSEKVTRRVYEIGKAQQAALDAMNKPARPPAPPPTLQNKRDAVLIDQLGAARAATGGLPPGTPPTRNATPNIPQVAQPVDAGMMQSLPEAPGQLTRSTPAPFVDARKEALQDLRRFNQEGIDYREGRRKEPPKPMKEEYIKELFSGQKPEAPAKGRKPPTEQNKRDKVLIDKELEAQRKKDEATFKEVLQKRKDIAVKLRRRDIAPKERATMEALDKQLGDLQKLMEKPATMESSKEPSKADSVLNEWRKQAR